MSYPTPEALRAHAAHARSMADAYFAEGNISMAERREADAEWYDELAYREEWRIERLMAAQQKEAA